MKQLDQWLQHIESFHPDEIELGLNRIRGLAQQLNLLELDSKVVLVGGTNGKGSTVAMLESMAINNGLKVGCYTSPHLVEFNERIRINGKNIDDQTLINTFTRIEALRSDVDLTFFEFTTLTALLIFNHLPLDLVVLEVGLGGRLDAVNIVDPDVSIITTIDIDHTDWLGSDIKEIAFEKSGIIRHEKQAFVGDKRSFELLCEVNQQVVNAIKLIDSPNRNFLSLIQDTALNKYSLLSQNLCLAYECFCYLFSDKLKSEAAQEYFADGIRNIAINGRFQWLSTPIETNIDVGHNPQAAKNLAKQVNATECEGRKVAICGMMADKAVDEVLSIMAESFNEWIFIDLNTSRAASSETLLACFKEKHANIPATKSKSMSEAYERLSCELGPNDQIYVFGSFITVASLLKHLQ